ncbi:MAG TPA: nuclear transport factor 2 family protein [Candidatus Bathyarchaeia archaeon]|jgi:hypothetical protein|nr:nuclear transport factor 2 family protein [Candidatus Bathyarchaeia archaeon]
MPDLADLEARIQRIEDIAAIQQLKYKYWRCLDQKAWAELAECFSEDATVSYGSGKYHFSGRDRIMKFLSESLGVDSGSIGIHHGHHPEIELRSATTARGRWALYNYLINTKQNRGVREGAFYEDEYVKQDGVWRIRHTGYTYVFHEEWSRDDTPSLRITDM